MIETMFPSAPIRVGAPHSEAGGRSVKGADAGRISLSEKTMSPPSSRNDPTSSVSIRKIIIAFSLVDENNCSANNFIAARPTCALKKVNGVGVRSVPAAE